MVVKTDARRVNDKCVPHIQTSEKPEYSNFAWNVWKVLHGTIIPLPGSLITIWCIFRSFSKISDNDANRRIYSLISVPQITRLLLRDARTSSKTDPRSGSKEKRSYGKVSNNKTMLTILSFVGVLCLN